MVRRLVAVVAVAACYESGNLPPPCQVACDFAGEGVQAACPDGTTCVGTGFLRGACVEIDDPVSCRQTVPPVAGLPFVASTKTLLGQPIEEDDPALTDDQLELFLLSNTKLLVATRDSTEMAFGTPTTIVEVDNPLTQLRPCVSADGLTLLFARDLEASPDVTQLDIFISTRPSRTGMWSEPVALPGEINTDGDELPAWISPDLLSLVFEAEVADGTRDLFIASRATPDDMFLRRDVRSLGSVNSPQDDGRGVFDASGTIFLFESRRPPSMGTAIWEAVADPATGLFTVVAHPELDSAAGDGTPWISADGGTVVFSSNRAGTTDDIFSATR